MWRRSGPNLAELIRATSDVITELALHPLTLDLDRGGALITATMDENALQTRSRGPYSPDNLPPEALSTIDDVLLRWLSEPERPEFAVEGGGAWPVLLVTLPASRVRVRYVVPEDAPPVYRPDPGNGSMSGGIRMTLRYLADALALLNRRTDPPVALTLSYPDDPRYEEHTAGLDGDALDFVPPVVAHFELDGSRLGARERAALGDALRRVLDGGWNVEPLGPHGLTCRFGWARLRYGG
jgi:hypothetical protein